MSEKVVTYQCAYLPRMISLCAKHEAERPEWVPTLGPVSHGLHDGLCEVCEREADDEAR